jgi:hypothetical protein
MRNRILQLRPDKTKAEIQKLQFLLQHYVIIGRQSCRIEIPYCNNFAQLHIVIKSEQLNNNWQSVKEM